MESAVELIDNGNEHGELTHQGKADVLSDVEMTIASPSVADQKTPKRPLAKANSAAEACLLQLATDATTALDKTTEIILVLSELSRLRAGLKPTEVERQLASEAFALLTALTSRAKPKEVTDGRAVQNLLVALGFVPAPAKKPRLPSIEKAMGIDGFQTRPVSGLTTATDNTPPAIPATSPSLPTSPAVVSAASGHLPAPGVIQTLPQGLPVTATLPGLSSMQHSFLPSNTDKRQLTPNSTAPTIPAPTIVQRQPVPAPPQPSIKAWGHSPQIIAGADHTASIAASSTHVPPRTSPSAGAQVLTAQARQESVPAVPQQQKRGPKQQAGIAAASPPAVTAQQLVAALSAAHMVQRKQKEVPAQQLAYQALMRSLQAPGGNLNIVQRGVAGPTLLMALHLEYPAVCQICQATQHGCAGLLMCDGCEKAFHVECLRSRTRNGRFQPPPEDWYCPTCLTEGGGKPRPPKYGPLKKGILAAPPGKGTQSATTGQMTNLLSTQIASIASLEKRAGTDDSSQLGPSQVVGLGGKLGAVMSQSARVGTKSPTASEPALSSDAASLPLTHTPESLVAPTPLHIHGQLPAGISVHDSQFSKLPASSSISGGSQNPFLQGGQEFEQGGAGTDRPHGPAHPNKAQSLQTAGTGQLPEKPGLPAQPVLAGLESSRAEAEGTGRQGVRREVKALNLPENKLEEGVHDRNELMSIPLAPAEPIPGLAPSVENQVSSKGERSVQPISMGTEEMLPVVDAKPDHSRHPVVDDISKPAGAETATGPFMEWVGAAMKEVGTRKHYAACRVAGALTSLGSCAHFTPEMPGDAPYIGRVQDLWEDVEKGQKSVRVAWCFYPQDIPPEVARPTPPLPHEVYESNHCDENPLGSITGPCLLLAAQQYEEEIKRRQSLPAGTKLPALYLRRFMYDAPRGAFSPAT